MTDNGPKIEVRHKNNVTVVELLVEEILEEGVIIDISDSLFSVAMDNPGLNIVLSFSKVKHFSSSALGMLIRMNKRVKEGGGTLKLCRIAPTLLEVFTITRLDKLFDIYTDEDQAVSSFD